MSLSWKEPVFFLMDAVLQNSVFSPSTLDSGQLSSFWHYWRSSYYTRNQWEVHLIYVNFYLDLFKSRHYGRMCLGKQHRVLATKGPADGWWVDIFSCSWWQRGILIGEKYHPSLWEEFSTLKWFKSFLKQHIQYIVTQYATAMSLPQGILRGIILTSVIVICLITG